MKRAIAIALMIVGASCASEIDLAIEGAGAVEGGAKRCDTSCRIPTSSVLILKASPADDWSFSGWGGHALVWAIVVPIQETESRPRLSRGPFTLDPRS